MRKCATCGYLVLGDGESCKHCGAALPVTAQPAPPAVAPVAAPVLVPAAAPPVPPVPPPFTRAEGPDVPPPPLPLGRDSWTPPAPVTAAPVRRRSTPRALLGVIVVVSMALGWVAVEHRQSALPSGTSAFVAGHGVAYSSPDHTFDAQFPAPPTVDSRVIPVGTSSAAVNMADLQADDYEVFAASMVMPRPVPAGQADAILRDVLNRSAAEQGDEITRTTDVTRDGVAGLDVRATVRDGYAARLLVLISGTRIYILGVHSKTGTDRLYDALVNSLIMH